VLRGLMGRLVILSFCAVRMSKSTSGFALAGRPCGSLLPLREMKGFGWIGEK
jgi:hypothetical protein